MEAESDQLFGKRLVRKLFVPLVIAVLAYAALLLYGDIHAVAAAIGDISFSTLSGAVLLSLASFFFRGLRWELYLRTVSIRVPFRDSTLVFLSGLGMSITPGKIGELLKSMLLKESRDVPVAKSAPIILAERVLDLGALLTLGALGLILNHSVGLAVALGVAGVLGFYIIGKSERLALFLVGVLTKIPRISGFREKLLTAHRALFELWSLPTYALAMTLSLLAWGLQAFILVLLAGSFPNTSIPLPHAFVVYSAPLLAGTLALIPGGLGLPEASMTGSLKALAGTSTTLAATLTLLVRGVTFWLAIFIGFGALAIWKFSRSNARVAFATPATGPERNPYLGQ